MNTGYWGFGGWHECWPSYSGVPTPSKQVSFGKVLNGKEMEKRRIKRQMSKKSRKINRG